MYVIHRFAALGLLLSAIAWPSAALAEDASMATKLTAINALADTANSEALTQTQALLAALPADASYASRRDIMKTRSRLLINAGKFQAAFLNDEDLLQRATAANDRDTANIARLYKVEKLLYSSSPAEALIELNKQQDGLGRDASAELLWAFNVTAGRTYNTLSKAELALSHTLKALELADKQGANAARARMTALSMISRQYITMKNPEKALQTVDAALAEPIAQTPSRPVASLNFTRGAALSAIGRMPEALAAFRTTLQISIKSGYAAIEAQVRCNIADLYLREHDYVAAEREARAALITSEQVQDQTAVLVARANIGLALGGQGRTSEAMYYIDSVTKSLRDAGSVADLESMLDETSRMYEKSSLFEQALAAVREQQQVQRKIFQADRERAVAALQERFDAVQREKHIELLARENQLKDADIRNRRLQLLVALMGAALMLVAGTFAALQYRRAHKSNARLQDLNAQLEFHAMRDPLTGLFNRRSFVAKMKARCAAACQERRDQHDTEAGLVLIDIDHFKHINDTWGHTAGDGVLVEIAARLNQTVRDSDMALRWGGEEFLIYTPGTNGVLLTSMVERLLHQVCSSPVQLGTLSIPVTLTAGFIALPFAGLSEAECGCEKAIQLADLALYLGKQSGRNRALGLMGMRSAGPLALEEIERDLQAAASKGIVDLVNVLGPPQRKAADAMSHANETASSAAIA